MLTTLFGRTGKKKIKEIDSFSFRYTCGDCANADVEYSLKREKGGCYAFIKPDGVPPEEEICFPADDSFVRALEEFLALHRVEKWNHFNGSDTNVSDGNSFRLHITVADGCQLLACGYEKWPKNYQAVKDGLEALFRQAEKSKKSD